ncbi:hypothetical protein ACOSP7_001661 [Xanthoceras sorbifolium]
MLRGFSDNAVQHEPRAITTLPEMGVWGSCPASTIQEHNLGFLPYQKEASQGWGSPSRTGQDWGCHSL